MLNFIGTGSAFNTELGNNSAFVKNNDSLILIDCGGTVFHRLQELSLLDGIQNLYIVITHTHPDHIGSLGDLIFYSYYILKKRPTIFFPSKELLKGILVSIGVTAEMYNINSSEKIDVKDTQFRDFSIEFVPVHHVDTIPAYGFVIKFNKKSLYYSGDAKDLSTKIIERVMNGEIDKIYQDTCGLDYEGNNHLSLRKLSSIVPKELRSRVYCMHLDKHITEKDIEDNGFNVIKMQNGVRC